MENNENNEECEPFQYGMGIIEDDGVPLTVLHFGGGDITLAPIRAEKHRATGIMFRQNDGSAEVGDISDPESVKDLEYSPKMAMLFDNPKSIDAVMSMLASAKIRLADNLGDRLTLLRKKSGLSIYKAAEKSRMTKARLNSLEIKRKTDITIEEATALSELYKCPNCFIAEFIKGVDLL